MSLPRPGRPSALAALGVVAALGLGFTTPLVTAHPATPSADFAPQLVTVHTPTRADKDRLVATGLDLTEHAGHDYIEVVLHSAADQAILADNGFTYDVRIADLLQRELERIQLDADFAAANPVTELPSGRNSYRVLGDFAAEIDALVAAHPDTAKRISIGRSLEGRDLTGIEIGRDVNAPDDGRPVFLMFGVHHAREWPSAEMPMEFAHDLLKNDGVDARITDLLDRGRVIIVPVSNPDGYDASRTSGALVDLRQVDGGDTVSILATPGNAYKRKNCRYLDGASQPAGTCVAVPSNGGYGVGVDLNRNYGALWGGPGADAEPSSPIYRGPAPFSEPETQAIRNLISTRQVTTLITNHTFSNLILRPVGVEPNTIGPDGFPIGKSPDEDAMKALGDRMAAENGYSSQFGWQLYDTTGTTEDYSYNATGGYGYTFEIGPDEFHPPYAAVVAEYLGTTAAAKDGGGNREAYLIAFEAAVSEADHAVIRGSATPGATLTVERSGTFPLWDGTPFADTVRTSMVVPADGTFDLHVNPSTRPFVASRTANILGEPLVSVDESGVTAPLMSSEIAVEVPEGATLLTFDLSSAALDQDDYDLFLYGPDGEELASSEVLGSDEKVSYQPGGTIAPGTYTVEVLNFAAASPWTVTGGAYAAEAGPTPRLFEMWTLSCSVGGRVLDQRGIYVERGQVVKDLDLTC